MARDTKPAKGDVHDSAQADDGKVYGLKLTQGGAPNTPHICAGVYVQIDPPGLVGEVGFPSLERAIRLSRDEGVPAELVEIPAKEADKVRDYWQKAKAAANRALARVERNDPDTPADQINDEAGAVTGEGV